MVCPGRAGGATRLFRVGRFVFRKVVSAGTVAVRLGWAEGVAVAVTVGPGAAVSVSGAVGVAVSMVDEGGAAAVPLAVGAGVAGAGEGEGEGHGDCPLFSYKSTRPCVQPIETMSRSPSFSMSSNWAPS